MTVIIIFIVASLVYLAVALILARSVHSRYARRPDVPTLSIVVPARNEEGQISELLESLVNVDYPVEKLQIVIVNDQSTDRTREIAASYAGRFRCRYEVLDAVDEPDGKLKAKTRPLAQGLDRAGGEIILMTDADCVVPPQWPKTMVSYFAHDIGMVCGMTLPRDEVEPHRLLTRFETLDWLFLLGSSAGMAGVGRPQGLIGNNFSVRRESYHAIGTYRALSFTKANSTCDDVSLQEAVTRSGRWKVIFPGDPGLMILTKSVNNLFELVQQRHRWLKGLVHVGWLGVFSITFGIVAHVTWPVWPFLIGPWFLLPLALIMLGDSVVLAKAVQCYGTRRLKWLIPLYPLFASLYGVGLVWRIFTRTDVRWKQRDF